MPIQAELLFMTDLEKVRLLSIWVSKSSLAQVAGQTQRKDKERRDGLTKKSENRLCNYIRKLVGEVTEFPTGSCFKK